MRMVQIFMLSVPFLLSGCAIIGGGGEDYLFRGEIGLLRLSPDGDLALSNTTVTSDNSLENLGLDDKESPPYAKGSLRFGASELSLSGFKTDFSGTGTITADFGNVTAGSAVSSELDITNLKLLYRWYIVDTDWLSVGPGIGVDYFDLDAEVSSSITAEDLQAKAPIPVPGISAVARLGPVRAFADIYGVAADVGDLDGTFLDVEAGLRVAPTANFDVFVGYRFLSFEASGTDGGQTFDVNYELPGLFFGGAIRF